MPRSFQVAHVLEVLPPGSRLSKSPRQNEQVTVFCRDIFRIKGADQGFQPKPNFDARSGHNASDVLELRPPQGSAAARSDLTPVRNPSPLVLLRQPDLALLASSRSTLPSRRLKTVDTPLESVGFLKYGAIFATVSESFNQSASVSTVSDPDSHRMPARKRATTVFSVSALYPAHQAVPNGYKRVREVYREGKRLFKALVTASLITGWRNAHWYWYALFSYSSA